MLRKLIGNDLSISLNFILVITLLMRWKNLTLVLNLTKGLKGIVNICFIAPKICLTLISAEKYYCERKLITYSDVNHNIHALLSKTNWYWFSERTFLRKSWIINEWHEKLL
jgi:hypothetical protein